MLQHFLLKKKCAAFILIEQLFFLCSVGDFDFMFYSFYICAALDCSIFFSLVFFFSL
jgi:hypothetical protein